MINPNNWYWLVNGDSTHVVSIAGGGIVPITDAGYVAWLAAGNLPSRVGFTAGSSLEESYSELYDILLSLVPALAAAVASAWLAAGYLTTSQTTVAIQRIVAATLAAGCEITSTGTPALSGTYPCDAATQSLIQAEALNIAVTGNGGGTAVFTNGTTSKLWLDISNNPHTFTPGEFTPFAEAIGQYVDAVFTWAQAGATGAPPGPPPAIA